MDGWMDELATMGFVELPVCEQPAPRDRSHRWAITDRLIYYSFNENSQTFSKLLSNFIQQQVKDTIKQNSYTLQYNENTIQA